MSHDIWAECKSIVMNERRYEYLLRHTEQPCPVQRELVRRTRELGASAEMQIPHELGVLLTMLARLVNARTIVEVGTFTGYSTLALARGLAPGGVVVTCESSTKWSAISDAAWTAAGVRERIDQQFDAASETIAALPETEHVDLVFLDADKTGYVGYWEQLVPRMRPGGLLVADNVLYGGEAAEDNPTGNAGAIDEFNRHVDADDRVEAVMLPVADGLTLARKR